MVACAVFLACVLKIVPVFAIVIGFCCCCSLERKLLLVLSVHAFVSLLSFQSKKDPLEC